MEVRLKNSPQPVTLTEVERDDDQVIIGATNTGKRFVARRENVAPPARPLPAGRHPYRIYLTAMPAAMRVVDPPFEEAETWLLDKDGEALTVLLPDGSEQQVEHKDVLSILSATPEDQAAAVAAAN